MFIEKAPVDSVIHIGNNILLLKVYSPKIAEIVKPGQFCNIKVSDTDYPLLRRPFSVSDVEKDFIFFMFNIYGEGTRLLSKKSKGEEIDILGPLGNGFSFNHEFETAIIVAGGLGAAPFPFLTKKLQGKDIYSFVGGKSESDIITYGMENILIATDDGSKGEPGNVVELLDKHKDKFSNKSIQVFSCGPNPMLAALKDFCIEHRLPCQASTECAMACGFGICQGCPIEKIDREGYLLVCKDGPVFEVRDVII